MISLTAVLASLPPASLAETDLARFAAQVLGRRPRSELPGLAALFAEETLRGYPPRLGAVLSALTETVVLLELDPRMLDMRAVDRLMASGAFLTRLGDKVRVTRQWLRPGTPLIGALRQTLGARLVLLPGVGAELTLVNPVEVAEVTEAKLTVPLDVALGRPMDREEAEALRAAWALIEERLGLEGPVAATWKARFVAVARRENHDAGGAIDSLNRMKPEERRLLASHIVAHLRDQEVPEQHRLGRRGLVARLTALGLPTGETLPEWLEATIAMIEAVYRAAGEDGEVIAGRPPVEAADVAAWLGWVEVPEATRDALRRLTAEQIEAMLVVLAEDEAGRAERPVAWNDALIRGLTNLRDRRLRPRWLRARWALDGLDPLAVAEARVAAGADRGEIIAALGRLGAEVAALPEPEVGGRTEGSGGRRDAGQERAAGRTGDRRAAEAGGREGALSIENVNLDSGEDLGGEKRIDLDVNEVVEADADARALTAEGGAARGGVLSAGGNARETGAGGVEGAGAASGGAGEPHAVRFTLPPLPDVPPPRPAPRVRPRTGFPALPDIGALPLPEPRLGGARAGTGGAALSRTRGGEAGRREASWASETEAQEGGGRGGVGARHAEPGTDMEYHGNTADSLRSVGAGAARRLPTEERVGAGREVRGARGRTVDTPHQAMPRRDRVATVPHLVTPGQAVVFYEERFRELEQIERERVHQGERGGMRERLNAIEQEAVELREALGPSARSGDREFIQAQRRVEKVLAYLERLRQPVERLGRGEGEADGVARPGLWRRLWGRGRG